MVQETIDDSSDRIVYSSLQPASNWRQDHLCQDNCHDLEDYRDTIKAFAKNHTWHTTRGGGRTSNATVTFQGSNVAASFILFKRDVAGMEEERVADVSLIFYIDGQPVDRKEISWVKMASQFKVEAPSPPHVQFIPNAVLFNRTVTPGPHSFTIQYDTGGLTERDTSLALDYISFTALSPEPTPASMEQVQPKPNVALILGVALGAVFLFLISGGFFFYRWYQRRKQGRDVILPIMENKPRAPSEVYIVPDVVIRQSPPLVHEPYPKRTIAHIYAVPDTGLEYTPSPSVVSEKIPYSPTESDIVEVTADKARSPPQSAMGRSFRTLSTLSIFSRPGDDLKGLPVSPALSRKHPRSLVASFTTSAGLSYTSYEQQWQAFSSTSEYLSDGRVRRGPG